jgi:hypothetical protein
MLLAATFMELMSQVVATPYPGKIHTTKSKWCRFGQVLLIPTDLDALGLTLSCAELNVVLSGIFLTSVEHDLYGCPEIMEIDLNLLFVFYIHYIWF